MFSKWLDILNDLLMYESQSYIVVTLLEEDSSHVYLFIL